MGDESTQGEEQQRECAIIGKNLEEILEMEKLS